MPKERVRKKDLINLLEIVFGKNWTSTHELDHDMLGYQITRHDKKHTCFNRNGRYSTREMYIYLSGMRDFIDEKNQT
jgi:hypothetical protein